MGLPIKDAIAELSVTLPDTDALYIFRVPQSAKELRKNPNFELLRRYLPIEELFRYAGDTDAMYELISVTCETEEESLTEAKHAIVPEHVRDSLEVQAFEWNEIYQREVYPQAKVLGVNFYRDMAGGVLAHGDRVVLIGPAPTT